MAYQSFTSYTKTAGITVSGDNDEILTSADMGEAENIYYRFGNEYFTGWRVRFRTSAADPVGYPVKLVGGIPAYNNTGIANTWTDGVTVYWKYDGANYTLGIFDITTGNKDTSSTLSASTTYYIIFYRAGSTIAKAEIYSDASFETLVDTIEITISYTFRGERYYPLSSFATLNSPDLLDQPWNSLDGWTPEGTGTNEQVTFDSMETLHTAGSSPANYCRQIKDIGTLGNTFSVHIREQYANLEAYATSDYYLHHFIGNGKYAGPTVYSDKVGFYANTFIDETNAEDVWTEWFWRIDLDTPSSKVWKRTGSLGSQTTWDYIGEITDAPTTAAADGTIRAAVSMYPVETYQDFLKVYSALETPEGGTLDVTVSHVEIFPILITDYVHPGSYKADDVFGVAHGENFDSVVDWNSVASDLVSGRLHVEGTEVNYIDFTAGTSNNWCLSAEVEIVAGNDGSACHTIGLADVTGTVRRAHALAVISGSNYYPALLYYDGSWKISERTDYLLNLNEVYTFQLVYTEQVDYDYLGFYINGQKVADVNAALDWSGNYPNRLYCGQVDSTYYGSTGASFYVDNLHFNKDRTFTHSGLALASNGQIVAGLRFSNVHGYDAGATFSIWTKEQSGDTFTLHQAINIDTDLGANEDARCQGSMIAVGNSVYIGVQSRNDTNRSTTLWDTYFLKATVSEGVLSQFSWVMDGASKLKITGRNIKLCVLDKDTPTTIICTSANIDTATPTNQFPYLLTYDTTTDTILSSGSWVALSAYADLGASKMPNETELFYDPEDNNDLVALIRHDGGAVPAPTFSYKKCTGAYLTSGNWDATHTDLSSTWGGNHGGNVCSITIGDKVWLIGYYRNSTVLRNWIAQIDVSTMSLLNEKYWNYGTEAYLGESGNGDAVSLGAATNKIYVQTNSGDLAWFEIEAALSGSLPIVISGDGDTGQWRFKDVDEVWFSEGTRESIVPGIYTIEFYDIINKITPEDIENVIIYEGTNTTQYGIYKSLSSIIMLIGI